MPNSITESFEYGRRLMLAQKDRQMAIEQQQLENKRNEEADKRAQQEEDRLSKQADLDYNVAKQAIELKRSADRAGFKMDLATGELPSIPGNDPVAVNQSMPQISLPGGAALPQMPSGLPQTIPTGGRTAVLEPEQKEFLGGDVSLNENQIKELQQAEAARMQRMSQGKFAESMNSPTVIAKGMEIDSKEAQQKYELEIKKLEREQKLADKETDRINRREDSQANARFSGGLTENRQIRAEKRKIENEETALQKVVGGGAGQLLSIQGNMGTMDFKGSTPEKLVLLSESLQRNTPAMLRAKGVEPVPGEIYAPMTKERGDAIRENLKIIPILKRTNELATRLIKEGNVSDSLLASMGRKFIEDIKGLGGLSEIAKALEPLGADSIILARTLTKDRVTDRDATAFMAQLIDQGLNTPLMQGRVNDLVDRAAGVIDASFTDLTETQRRAFWPETLNLEEFKNITPGNKQKIEQIVLHDGTIVNAYKDENGDWVKVQ